jgi:hypothetical protein
MGLATVMFGFDLQGWITLLAGALLALIALLLGTAMSTSSGAAPSLSTSKSEFLSSLPRWRRLLSTLNWRPVVDLEIRSTVRKKRMQQLENEISQIESENERLAELNVKLGAILSSSDTNSSPTNPTPNELEM